MQGVSNLHLPQWTMGVASNLTAQPPDMSSFSSTDRITFWPWKKEVMTILRHSGMPHKHWAEVLLQHVCPPALNKVTTTSRTSNNIDCIPGDLQYHYGDPRTAIATLTRCHIALGPIPDPVLYKKAALTLVKSHSQVLASSAALLNCADTPAAPTSIYSNQFW